VRTWMVEHQRAMGANGGVIMEGRDIGTVVFPNAEVKIFLDADQTVRAGRRIVQHNAQNDPKHAGRLVADLQERDRRDSTREMSPLKAADDAVHIDSTGLNIEQVTVAVEKVVEERLRKL
jgi:CMP/dCMP kinase